MATKKKATKKEVVVLPPITEEDITSVAQLSRAKMNNVKKSIQEEGLADIIAFNERFKGQPQQVHPDWKK